VQASFSFLTNRKRTDFLCLLAFLLNAGIPAKRGKAGDSLLNWQAGAVKKTSRPSLIGTGWVLGK
jgi:hypothetical protein